MGTAYLTTQRALGALLVVIGLWMAISAVARGGGPLAFGVVVGIPFALLGAGRIWLAGGAKPRSGDDGP